MEFLKYCAKNKGPIILFTLFSIILMIWGISGIVTYKNAVQVEAVITEIKEITDSDYTENYSNYVTYTYNGEEYSNVHAFDTVNKVEIGKKVQVYVNCNNPNKLASDEGGVPLGIGIFFFIGVLSFVLFGYKYDKMQKKWNDNVNKMRFAEFTNKNFNGDEEKALECLVREYDERFELTQNASQWFEILISLTDEQKNKYEIMAKKYRSEHKHILNKADVLASMNDYIKKRNGLAIFFGITTVLALFYIPFFCIMLFVYITLLIWIIKKNMELNSIRNNKFYIVKSNCSYKNIETSTVDYSDVDTHKISFPGFKSYEVTKSEYESIVYGGEYFLVVPNYNPKKIINIFDADIYDLSDEFYLSGDKYLINK